MARPKRRREWGGSSFSWVICAPDLKDSLVYPQSNFFGMQSIIARSQEQNSFFCRRGRSDWKDGLPKSGILLIRLFGSKKYLAIVARTWGAFSRQASFQRRIPVVFQLAISRPISECSQQVYSPSIAYATRGAFLGTPPPSLRELLAGSD